jgi:type IV pilus assembly protein PilY1
LANKVTRVMIFGGGYDLCYENPQFKVGTTAPNGTDLSGCSGISSAAGNSVYIVNAKTGAPIWTFTANCSGISACSADTDMTDSVVSPIATLDRDGDGFIDHLYFADLGGKVYRADINNTYGTTAAALGVQVTTLANLATTSTGAAITAGNAPRFYEQPNLTYFKQGANAFILVNVASGDRSNPLDVLPAQNGGPTISLPTRPVNNVYGIIDSDFSNPNLITGSPTLVTKNLTLKNLLQNPQTNGAIGGSLYSGSVPGLFLPGGGTYNGWYRSLSANNAGTEPAAATYTAGVLTGGSKTPGGKKAFEKPLAIQGYLIASVYDPEGTSVPTPSACSPRVIGETDSETFCLPYGVCYTASTGKVNSALEVNTGALANPATSGTLMGPGIRAVQLVSPAPVACTGTSCTKTTAACSNLNISNNQSTLGSFSCATKLIPTRWYEKLPNPKLVN